jgi:hypothetical protein
VKKEKEPDIEKDSVFNQSSAMDQTQLKFPALNVKPVLPALAKTINKDGIIDRTAPRNFFNQL